MDVFLVLQILFDAVVLFGVLFLFHFSVNQQQKRKEEQDIVKDIQAQETKENLEKLMFAVKELGKEVSEDIQKKIVESEEKAQMFQNNIQKMEKELNATMALAEEITEERTRLERKMKIIRNTTDLNEQLPSDEKRSVKSSDRNKKEKKTPPVKTGSYSAGFSSSIIRQVYKMADSASDIADIAKATKLSKAEVNLILNLRENRFTTPN